MSACPLSLLPEAEATVWPEIPEGSDVLNVGFAPGRDEVAVGRPFVGPSGKLLRQWLRQTGLLERSAFVNVEGHRTRDYVCARCKVEYRLYQGKLADAYGRAVMQGIETKPPTKTQRALLDKWDAALNCEHAWKEVRGNREPTKDEGCALPLITKLLEDAGRWKVVLCWGAVPARLLGGYKGPVGSMVGRFRTLPEHHDVLATVLYHPAYALRQRGSPAFAQTESLTKEILRQVYDRLEQPAGKDRYPFLDLTWAAEPFMIAGDAVVDIETEVAGKTPDPRVDTPRTFCVGAREGSDVTLFSGSAPFVVPTNAKLLMHNAQYDLPLLYRMTGDMTATADDTMVMAYLCQHEQLSLKILARRLLGRHAREYLEKSGDDDHEYDAQDPHLTRDLYHLFRPQIDQRGLAFLYDEVKTPLQRILARHVVQGLRLDQLRIRALHTKMEVRATTLLQQIQTLVDSDFNPRSPAQVARYLYDVLGLSEDHRTGRTTNETHIGQFRAEPFVALLLSYRKAQSFISRYTAPLGQLERVSGLYDLTGTGTDRVSQSNRNCMNFPGLVKQCIQADEGGYFVYGDYCLGRSTRVLKSDLTYVPAHSLIVGDELIGFDETIGTRTPSHFKRSIVESVGQAELPCYKVVTPRGSFVASARHKWVCRPKRFGVRQWIETQDLSPGMFLGFTVEPWEPDTSYEGGWLAGFLDGEGWISGTTVGVGQNPGPCLDRVKEGLEARGAVLTPNLGRKCQQWRDSSSWRGVRTLGMLRPKRLLAKASQLWEGRRTWGRSTPMVPVETVEYLGVRPVTTIRTSTRTLIAEGFLSHNSQIELRTMAYFSRDPYLLSVLYEGRNMHDELCRAIYGARTPDTYTQAKSANFARAYGAGVKRRASTLKIPVSVVAANEIPWSGWDAWVAARRREPARTYWGYERNLDGALDSTDEYLRDKAMRQVVNSIIQGSAGEINQYAQVLGDRYLSDLGGYVIHQEHDSVLGWLPDSVPEDEGRAALAQAMSEAVPQEIKDVVDIPAKVVTGQHWG